MLRRLYLQRGWFWTGFCIALAHVGADFYRKPWNLSDPNAYSAAALVVLFVGVIAAFMGLAADYLREARSQDRSPERQSPSPSTQQPRALSKGEVSEVP